MDGQLLVQVTAEEWAEWADWIGMETLVAIGLDAEPIYSQN